MIWRKNRTVCFLSAVLLIPALWGCGAKKKDAGSAESMPAAASSAAAAVSSAEEAAPGEKALSEADSVAGTASAENPVLAESAEEPESGETLVWTDSEETLLFEDSEESIVIEDGDSEPEVMIWTDDESGDAEDAGEDEIVLEDDSDEDLDGGQTGREENSDDRIVIEDSSGQGGGSEGSHGSDSENGRTGHDAESSESGDSVNVGGSIDHVVENETVDTEEHPDGEETADNIEGYVSLSPDIVQEMEQIDGTGSFPDGEAADTFGGGTQDDVTAEFTEDLPLNTTENEVSAGMSDDLIGQGQDVQTADGNFSGEAGGAVFPAVRPTESEETVTGMPSESEETVTVQAAESEETVTSRPGESGETATSQPSESGEEAAPEAAESVYEAENAAESLVQSVAENSAQPEEETPAQPVTESLSESVTDSVAEETADFEAEPRTESVTEEPAEPDEDIFFEEPAESETESVAEEDDWSEAEILFEEPAESGTESVIEEPAESDEEIVIEEPAESEEESVIEEPAESEEESVIEEPAESEEEIVIEEPAESEADSVTEIIPEEPVELLADHVSGISAFSIVEGMQPDVMAGISWDETILKVEPDTNGVNWNTVGMQTLRYLITAADGRQEIASIPVKINPDLDFYLYGMEGTVTIKPGDSFDPMAGLTWDDEISSVEADVSGLDRSVPGSYLVSYTLTARDGRVQSTVRQVTVSDGSGDVFGDNVTDSLGMYTTITDLGLWRLTAYMDTPQDQGPYVGQTASGAPLVAGRTVAVSAATCARLGLQFGDRLMIDGHIYVLEDHGGSAMNDQNWADIFVDNPADEYSDRFNRFAEVYLLR